MIIFISSVCNYFSLDGLPLLRRLEDYVEVADFSLLERAVDTACGNGLLTRVVGLRS